MLRSAILPCSVMKRAVKTLLVSYVRRRISCHRVVTDDNSEVLDNFVDSLMTNKMNKWRSIHEVPHKSDMEIPTSDDAFLVKISSFTPSSVDDYVYQHLASPYLESILNACRSKEVCPSPETLTKAAHTFAKSGNKTGIETIISLSTIGNCCDEKKKEEFKIFKAEAMWRGGDSVQKSLEMLIEAYKYHHSLRRFVRSSLRSLFGEVVKCRGEASLFQVKNVALQLAGPPYDDPVPLSFLWGQCILSEWFADQQMSVEIVNINRENSNFRRALHNRLDAVVSQALAGHQVDAVYRVLETLLTLSLDTPAQAVLGKLFDYKYILGDKSGCEAILKLCAVTDLDVGYTRRKQFENAGARWANRRNIMITHKKSSKLPDSSVNLPVPKYEFKM